MPNGTVEPRAASPTCEARVMKEEDHAVRIGFGTVGAACDGVRADVRGAERYDPHGEMRSDGDWHGLFRSGERGRADVQSGSGAAIALSPLGDGGREREDLRRPPSPEKPVI